MSHDFIKNVHYYLEDTRVIFTGKWLALRGECCGNKCRHCPYSPKWTVGTKKLEYPDSEESFIFDKTQL